jgi:predicted nucleotidyltransferase
MHDYRKLLTRLVESEVRFVIIGGFAAVVYGSSIVTEDLDLCVPFDRENMDRLLTALAGTNPGHRLIGESRSLDETAEKLSSFKNLYLSTDLGTIDFLAEVSGVGRYEEALKNSEEIKVFGLPCRVLSVETLIQAKKSMTRPKDKETVIQLEAIKEKTRPRSS